MGLRKVGMNGAAVVLAAVVACGGSSIADTDCEAPDSPAERVRFASLVLHGTVTGWDGTTAQFQIDEIWRGPDMPREVEIIPEVGRAYTSGVEYLLFPSNSPSPLGDARCSATTRWSADLAKLRPQTARAPGETPAEDADLPWEWLIGAVVVIGLYIGTRRLIDRRHPAPVWDPDFDLRDHHP